MLIENRMWIFSLKQIYSTSFGDIFEIVISLAANVLTWRKSEYLERAKSVESASISNNSFTAAMKVD